MLKGRHILSIKEFQKEEILSLLSRAQEKKEKPLSDPILKGKIMASCFFEPSTRTRLSFESAMKRLGGEVIGFSDPTFTSQQKGESFSDMMRVIGFYADLIVIRHPLEGAAREASEVTGKPVINAGDGANEHPTQTLLDLFTINECQKKLEGLSIAFAGDLLYGRTVHSLALAFTHFDSRLYFVSPPSLSFPELLCKELRHGGVRFSFHQSLEEIIDKIDILYMTRLQRERFANDDEYLKLKDRIFLKSEVLKKAKPNLKILHPLPRVHELPTAIDSTNHAHYFIQAQNGVFLRQALLEEVLR